MYQQFAADFTTSGGQLAFGITGSGPSLSLIDALEKHGATFITTGHESTAALMAGACARLAGKPALALSIKGPGFMNMLPGLLCNAYEGLPSLSLAESYPQGHADARCHKWLDHRAAAAEFLKQQRFFDPGQGFLGHCWASAREEFPGPVHIDLGAGENIATVAAAEAPDSPDFEQLANRIAQCSRPVLIVGSLGLRAPWGSDLQHLAIPVFTTPAGKGVLDESLAMAAGVFTGAGKPDTPEKRLLPAADLLVMLGVRAGEILNPAFDRPETLQIDTLAASGGQLFPARSLGEQHILSEAQIGQLLGLLQQKPWGEERIVAARGHLDVLAEQFGWSPITAMRVLQAVLPGATHVLDTGNFTVLGEHFLKATTPSSLLGTPNGRYMGAGLGYALGAAFALPDTPVVLWIGDGGIRSLLGELALAADHNRKLLVMVMKDGYFGSIRGSALSNGLTQNPVKLSKRSLLRIGEALGLHTLAAGSESQLHSVLDGWRRNPVTTLCECPLEPDRYIELTARLR
ncbi:MAG: thiamine pyrophosphate-dependent enzyme [Gammaproteobacteria bacterium]